MKINKKSNLIKPVIFLVGILIFIILMFHSMLSFAKQEEQVIKEFEKSFLTISTEEKLPLTELEKQFPKDMSVHLQDGSTKTIPVKWKCERDYMAEQLDTYVFEVVLPEGFILSKDGMLAYIRVSIGKGIVEPELFMAYSGNPNGSITLDQHLGVKQDVVSYLESYENSNYYLGTPYYGKIGNGNINHCMVPNGEGADGITTGMNCTGFVAKVLQNVGADCSRISQRMGNHYVNAVNWLDTAYYHDCKFYRYNSVSEMLASGMLKKGDLIYFEPNWSVPGVDCHIGFFWGNTSDENKFWHSQASCDNAITDIRAKGSYDYVYIIKLEQKGELEIQKESSEYDLVGRSMKNAEFGIYRDEATRELLKTVVTDESGKTIPFTLQAGSYYIKELVPPKGFVLCQDVIKVVVESGKRTTCKVKNKGTLVKIVKVDRVSGRMLQGAVFSVWEKKSGNSVGEYVTSQNGEIHMKGLAPGTYCVKETTAPRKYLLEEIIHEFTIADDGMIQGKESLELIITNDSVPFSIIVHKTDQDGVALNGAQFTLYNDRTCTSMHSMVDISNGIAEFNNLKVRQKYYLQETKKPQGYYGDEDEKGNRRIYEIQVQIDETTGEWKYLVDGKRVDSSKIEQDTILHMTVINRKGYQLPETGSSQTLVYLMAGSVLMVTAIRKKIKE